MSNEERMSQNNPQTLAGEMLDAVLKLGGDPADLPFWQACAEGRFLLHRCHLCDRHYWPASRCIEHGNEAMAWVEVSGAGELYTYTVMHKVMVPGWKEKAPYVVGVVKLDQGPMFHTNVIGCELDDVQVGMRLVPEMSQQGALTVPLYKPAS